MVEQKDIADLVAFAGITNESDKSSSSPEYQEQKRLVQKLALHRTDDIAILTLDQRIDSDSPDGADDGDGDGVRMIHPVRLADVPAADFSECPVTVMGMGLGSGADLTYAVINLTPCVDDWSDLKWIWCRTVHAMRRSRWIIRRRQGGDSGGPLVYEAEAKTVAVDADDDDGSSSGSLSVRQIGLVSGGLPGMSIIHARIAWYRECIEEVTSNAVTVSSQRSSPRCRIEEEEDDDDVSDLGPSASSPPVPPPPSCRSFQGNVRLLDSTTMNHMLFDAGNQVYVLTVLQDDVIAAKSEQRLQRVSEMRLNRAFQFQRHHHSNSGILK